MKGGYLGRGCLIVFMIKYSIGKTSGNLKDLLKKAVSLNDLCLS